MKFRAVIHDHQLMREFLNTVTTLSKLTKECVMRISRDNVIFIINEESSSSAPLVWTDIDRSVYFESYIMEGVGENHNHIYFAFNPANLARSLSMIARGSVSSVKIKLTNKQFPCLTVDLVLPSSNTVENRQIVHDVPITMIPPRDWNAYKMPRIPDSQIILAMPSLRFLRNLIDKVKNLSPSITFHANHKGELSIIAETDLVTVASHYRNLEVKRVNCCDNNGRNDNDTVGGDDDDENDNEMNEGGGRGNNDGIGGRRKNTAATAVTVTNDKEIEVACLVDCKKTAIFLSALQMNKMEMSCGIIQDHLIRMEIEIRRGMSMHCIIPAVCI